MLFGIEEMRKIFKHTYIVKLLAFVALTMAVISISSPEIDIYNWTVEREQKDLQIAANGTPDGILSFSSGDHYSTNPYFFAEVAFFLTLFFSLSFTKKISFSLLLAFLFLFQFVICLELFRITVEFPMSYFYNRAYSILFVACVLALTYWEASLICRFFHRVSLGLKKNNFQ